MRLSQSMSMRSARGTISPWRAMRQARICRDSTADELRALSLGGDDYVTKPYDIPVLLARIPPGSPGRPL